MPFKSKAQRRKFYAMSDSGEISKGKVKEWEEATGGKKLPERVKQAEEFGFLDEVEKIARAKEAGAWDDIKDFGGDVKNWVGKNPYLTAAGVGGLAASGVIGKRLLQKAAPTTGARQAQLRGLAERHGLSFPSQSYQDLSTLPKPRLSDLRSIEGAREAGGLTREYLGQAASNLRARLRMGGLRTVDPNPMTAAGGTVPKLKGVTVGMHSGASGAGELHGTDVTQKAMRKLHEAGKPAELSPEVGLSHLFERGGSVADLAKKKGIKVPSKGASIEERKKYLTDVQRSLKEEYGEFVMKPSDLSQSGSAAAFPSHKGDWGKLLEDYETRLKPQMQKLEAEVRATPSKFKGMTPQNVTAKKFREDPAYAGTGLEYALKDPSRTLGQKMMNLVKTRGGTPAEYRVHMMGGAAPKEFAYNRYSTLQEVLSRLPIVNRLAQSKRLGSSQEAAEWVSKNVSPAIAKKYRAGTFGLDVVRVNKPGGGYDYKLVELNPSSTAGASGFLDASVNPAMPHDVYKWVRGKSSPTATAAKALGLGTALAAPTAGVASAIGD